MKRVLSTVLALIMMLSCLLAISVSADTAEEQLENILTTGRVMPTEPTLAYEDTAATQYKPGYVLHYMDFSKVASFADTGYFVTNDKEPLAFMLQNGELRIKNNAGDGVRVVLTGNEIPKNIQNFTFEFKFRFIGSDNVYFVFLHNIDVNAEGKKAAQKDTCFRFNEKKIDNSTPMEEAADVSAFWDAVHAGQEVTFTYCAMDRETYRIIVTCGEKTITWIKSSNTKSVANFFPGFMVGRSTDIAFSSVKLIAGVPDDYAENGLIWPGAENALVQNVSADAIVDTSAQTQETPVVTTGAAPTPTRPAETPKTSAPTTEVTNAPQTTTGASTVGEEKGCKSLLSGSWAILAIMIVSLAVVVPVKRIKND